MRAHGAQAVKLSVVPGNDDAVRFYERLGLRTSMLEMMAPLPPPGA
jgi:ribosomal protein S18 acetylase RimI-like enzyme